MNVENKFSKIIQLFSLEQLKLEVLDTYQELQAIVDELEASECAATTESTPAKVKVSTSKDISNGELISTAKHVRYLVTRRHQMGSLLAQIADMKNSLNEQSKKVSLICMRPALTTPIACFLCCLYNLIPAVLADRQFKESTIHWVV